MYIGGDTMSLNNQSLNASEIWKTAFKDSLYSTKYCEALVDLYKLSMIVSHDFGDDSTYYQDFFIKRYLEFNDLAADIRNDILKFSDNDLKYYVNQSLHMLDERISCSNRSGFGVLRAVRSCIQSMTPDTVKQEFINGFSGFSDKLINDKFMGRITNMSDDEKQFVESLDIDEVATDLMLRLNSYGEYVDVLSDISDNNIVSSKVVVAIEKINNSANMLAKNISNGSDREAKLMFKDK